MSATANRKRDILIITCITIGLFLLIDLVLGHQLLSIAKGELPKDKFRASHPIYHHTLIPDYEGIGYWGPGTYHVCTNGSAFKDSCAKKGVVEKSFDIAFMGDSFTEGVGLPFEQTFVGMVAAKLPELKIANLGVVSYAPSIYLAKLRDLYARGYEFKKVIVFIDIGDVQDEALTYETVDSKVISRHEQLPPGGMARVRRIASRWFPLTGEAWNRIRASANAVVTLIFSTQPKSPAIPVGSRQPALQTGLAPALPSQSDTKSTTPAQATNTSTRTDSAPSPAPGAAPLAASVSTPPAPQVDTLKAVLFAPAVEPSIYDRNYSRSEWTYNIHSAYYGEDGVMGTIQKMLATMDELHRLVKDHGAELSVGVYPWPGQLKYDREDSLQTKIWRDFCATRCKHFYNAFPAFFKLLRERGEDAVIHEYYMGGDMHFSEAGNAVIAQTILSAGIQ